ncbi:MAG TPA: hypothetical protein VN680_06920 [Burkholderiaceae bacterium]|jgi:hypothetical protein|nr:hypothetical protein [Burkholderiaceae bacterium]
MLSRHLPSLVIANYICVAGYMAFSGLPVQGLALLLGFGLMAITASSPAFLPKLIRGVFSVSNDFAALSSAVLAHGTASILAVGWAGALMHAV